MTTTLNNFILQVSTIPVVMGLGWPRFVYQQLVYHAFSSGLITIVELMCGVVSPDMVAMWFVLLFIGHCPTLKETY